MNSHHPNQNGFTLVELIIALSISVLIFVLLTQVYLLAQRTYGETDAKAEITQNGRVILDRMIREIRQTPQIITILPADTSDPANLPSEIMFQDGHNTAQIQYIRYYLDGHNINRESSVYYFPSEPLYHVHSYDTDKDPPHNPPVKLILDDRVIGEFVDDMEFWGNGLLNINLYLSRNSQNTIINTAVYGRNL